MLVVGSTTFSTARRDSPRLSSSCALRMMRCVIHMLWRIGAALASLAVVVLAAGGPGLASDFLTEGVDNARTGWVRDEKVFTTANVGQHEAAVEADARQHATCDAQPVRAARRRAGRPRAQGTRELAVVAGVSDDLFGIDVATGQQIWHRRFDSTLANPGGTNDTLCPGGQTAVPTMAQTSPGKYTVYAVSWDGRLRQVNLADGEDVVAPREVHPGWRQTVRAQPATTASSTPRRRRAAAASPMRSTRSISPRAGPAPSSRQAVDCGDAAARPSIPKAGCSSERATRQFDPLNRRLGNGIVAVKLDANKQLQLVDFFGAPNANWLWRRDLDVNTTPMAFDAHGRKFLVGTSKECRLWLLDRDALGGEDHRTTLHTTPLICNDAQAFDAKGIWGALGAWQDDEGHAVGARAVLGAGEQRRSRRRSSMRGRPAEAWPHSRCSSAAGRLAADAGLALARHGSRRGSRDRQRHRLHVCGR